MYAAMGFITPECFKFPGYLSPSYCLEFEDVPSGLAATDKAPVEDWLRWVALCGFCETVANEPNASEPGNYGRGWRGSAGKSMEDPAKRSRSLNPELANSRPVRAAIMSIMFQSGTSGTTGPRKWLPASAFGSELGMQAPVGPPWDPMGFCKNGDVDYFKRRRETVLKRGRVAMYAAMCFITPEYGVW
jgi:hypothetical protein